MFTLRENHGSHDKYDDECVPGDTLFQNICKS